MKDWKAVFCLSLLGALVGCARNVPYEMEHAKGKWEELGYTIVGYEGYEWDLSCGGMVWHSLRRQDTPGVIYSGSVCKWGNELHVYGPQVVSGDISRLGKR